jgi:hypothetical protein
MTFDVCSERQVFCRDAHYAHRGCIGRMYKKGRMGAHRALFGAVASETCSSALGPPQRSPTVMAPEIKRIDGVLPRLQSIGAVLLVGVCEPQ